MYLKLSKTIVAYPMQTVVRTSMYEFNSIGLYKHFAIVFTKIFTPSEPANKISTSKAVAKIYRLFVNTSFLFHITKLIIPID